MIVPEFCVKIEIKSTIICLTWKVKFVVVTMLFSVNYPPLNVCWHIGHQQDSNIAVGPWQPMRLAKV